MTIETPLWAQGQTYTGRQDRNLLDIAVEAEGVFDGMRVTQRALGANFTVDIGIGRCAVKGDENTAQGVYLGWVSALENRTVTGPPGSGSRKDIVIARIYDPAEGTGTTPKLDIEVIAGTPAASNPAEPAVPNSAIKLAVITIVAGQATITDTSITDTRPAARLRGALAPGSLVPYTGATLPAGFLWANAGIANRYTHFGLFRENGTAFGAGDGSTVNGVLTTFNVPDMRGRTATGMDQFGGSAAAGVLDQVGALSNTATGQIGSQYHTLAIGEIPSHNHGSSGDHVHAHDHAGPSGIQYAVMEPANSAYWVNSGAVADHVGDITYLPTTGAAQNFVAGGGNHTHTSQGGGAGHNNMQPSRFVAWLVKT